jgi:hypothetical protein
MTDTPSDIGWFMTPTGFFGDGDVIEVRNNQ